MEALDRATAQRMLNEIARMSYGSGFFFEGTSGGRGNIGLITGADGQPRVIKFNTHSNERGGTVTEAQLKSANALRAQFLAIANALNPGVVTELRAKLGLGANEEASAGQTLLERTITAQAVKLINANGMTTAMEGVNAEALKSVGGTKFEEASVYATYGVSAKTLKACGEMSTTEFEAAVNAMAGKFHLSPAQKQAVGRSTASYLTALAEEGKTGQLDEGGNPKDGLPSKDELKRQISEGTFGGTYFGLVHVKTISAKKPPFSPEDKVFGGQTLDLANSMSDDECADAAYFIAKMGTGKRGENGSDNRLMPLALKTLVDHRTELMALHLRNGTLSINDMWNVIVGRNAPEDVENGSAADFSKAVGLKLLAKITQDRPEAAQERWGGDYVDFEFAQRFIMTPVVDFGVSVDVGVKLFFGEDVGDVRCSRNSSAYDVGSKEYADANEQSLVGVISTDIGRCQGECSIKVGNAYELDIGPLGGDDFANENAPDLMKYMNRLIGGGDKIGKPVPNQLKTMCYMCSQAGNSFLALAGLAANKLDHYPVDKSFTLQKDGSVLYTASGEVDGLKHTVKYQIEKDGTSHLVDYTRTESPETIALMQPVREVTTPRLAKLTDFVRAKGTEAEKANLANYRDSIVTAKNFRALKDKVGKALADRPASVVQNVTANLMAFFAEINLRQAAKGRPLDSFETLLSRYAGNDEKLRLLDFSLSDEQLGAMPGTMKNWLVDGFTGRMKEGTKFHDKTNVLVRSLREFSDNVTINGELPPEKPSKADIVDGGRTITFDELKDDGGTSVSGANSQNRNAFHETLVKTFTDPKVRAFVSFLISMSEGVKGGFTSMFDLPGPNSVSGTELPQFMQLAMRMQGSNAQPTPLDKDPEAKGVYAITIDPDEVGPDGAVVKKGKIKIVVNSAEGMALKGPGVGALAFGNEDIQELEFGIARQKYETTVTIDPNEIGENGIPSFTVDKPVLK